MILFLVLFKVLAVLFQAIGWIMFWMAMSVFFVIWLIITLPLRVVRG